jgi:[ribosomal protein S5]-alanine N-acetyltransferase
MKTGFKTTFITLVLICIPLRAGLTPPTLETERCILRPITLDDAPAVFPLASDPEIARYTSMFGSTLHLVPKETRSFIQRCLDMQRNNYGMCWVIIEKYSDTIIGMMSLFGYSSAHRKAEFGYALSPAYWGMGIATEVSKALIQSVFTQLDLMRLQATVDPENMNSIRVLIKCGMQYEGLLRNYYIVHDESRSRAMYALTQEEFFAYYADYIHENWPTRTLVSQPQDNASFSVFISELAHYIAAYLRKAHAQIHPSH